jgi:hypothetical protein
MLGSPNSEQTSPEQRRSEECRRQHNEQEGGIDVMTEDARAQADGGEHEAHLAAGRAREPEHAQSEGRDGGEAVDPLRPTSEHGAKRARGLVEPEHGQRDAQEHRQVEKVERQP